MIEGADPNPIDYLISKYFAEFPEFHSIYLFGSAVSGERHKNSDIDIAISRSSRLTLEEELDIKSNLENLLRQKVDLVDLCGLEGLLVGEILLKGKPLKMDLEYYLSKLRAYHNYMSSFYFPYLLPDRKSRILSYF